MLTWLIGRHATDTIDLEVRTEKVGHFLLLKIGVAVGRTTLSLIVGFKLVLQTAGIINELGVSEPLERLRLIIHVYDVVVATILLDYYFYIFIYKIIN